jgi:copper resistance protein D
MIDAGLARFIQYAGAAIMFGAPLFYLTALPRSGAIAASDMRWSRLLPIGSSALLLFGAVLSLILQSAMMNGIALAQLDWPAIEVVLTATHWGLAIIIRATLAAAALGLALLMRPSRALWFASIALGLLILASFAWTGHGAASQGPWAWVHLLSDIVHAVAAGVWIGALVCFLMLLFRPSDSDEANVALYSALHGFSRTGSLVVSALVITGVVNTVFIVGPSQITGLVTSSYGWVLGIKILAFAGMVALAGVNRFRLTPGLKASFGTTQTAPALAHLKSSLLFETVLGFCVLVLVGFLGLLEPPAGAL